MVNAGSVMFSFRLQRAHPRPEMSRPGPERGPSKIEWVKTDFQFWERPTRVGSMGPSTLVVESLAAPMYSCVGM